MSLDSPRKLKRIVRQSRFALGMTQLEMGDAMGVSHRTVLRWENGSSVPVDDQVATLSTLVREVSDELADEMLEARGMRLPPAPESPPPPQDAPPPPPPAAPPPAAPSPLAPRDAVDVVVYAAAEAMDASPRAVRLALAAAFARAEELGLSVEAVARSLRPSAT
ncbi:MAG: helix-turn-helix transcriptional regulator [Polyangiaceae bacterium]